MAFRLGFQLALTVAICEVMFWRRIAKWFSESPVVLWAFLVWIIDLLATHFSDISRDPWETMKPIVNIVPKQIQDKANDIYQASIKQPVNLKKFKVYIYKDELDAIERWVQAKDRIETGGDLFGLWLDGHNVVVQFVLGPGKNCRRTTTSFYQDLEYLESVGNYITKKQGLCNVGQWHSHHRLNLSRPSAGDEDTVWNNMPGLGMERYVVFIATIKDSVDVNCFLFEIENETKLPVLHGEICVLKCEDGEGSPVRSCEELTDLVKSGMEEESIADVKGKDNNSVAIDIYDM